MLISNARSTHMHISFYIQYNGESGTVILRTEEPGSRVWNKLIVSKQIYL